MTKEGWSSRHEIVSIPLEGNFEATKNNIKAFARLTFLSDELSETPHVIKRRFGSKAKEEFVISRAFNGDASDPDRVNGFVIRPNKIDVGYDLSGYPLSEVEFAYEVLISSLVATGKIDFSTPENQAASRTKMRELFMRIYQTTVQEYMPVANREEIFGVDNQIEEIKTNLYEPPSQKSGHPMNVLLVGAPGVGKSLVSRYFLANQNVLTVSLPVSSLEGRYFEHGLIPELSRIRDSLDLPVVVHIDDVEILLEAGMNIDDSGRVTQVINPEERSRALSLLERLEDTHGIYILGTLNHPDVEAAFLRRFHPVYFPLPNSEIRKQMVQEIFPQNLPEADCETQSIVDKTEGFNYNSMALIPRYIQNYLLTRENITIEDYREAIVQACNWARARAGINKLKQVDEIARRMVGLGSEKS